VSVETRKKTPSMAPLPNGPASQMPVPYDVMMRDMANQYGLKAKEALVQQQQGLGQLEDNLNEMRRTPRGLDFTAAAAFSDSMNPGSNLTQAAIAMKPETEAQRAEKLLALQGNLQQRKSDMSKNNLAALKEQIDAYKASKIDPLDVEMKKAKINFYGQGRQNLQDQRLAEAAHKGILANIEHNKPMQQKLQQIQGLDNAGAMIEHAPEVTPQLFHDYQQAVVGAIVRGNSGVGERAERYLTSAGISGTKIKQFFSGEPGDIGKDNAMLKAIQGFAQTERINIGKQYDEIIDAASEGQGRWYDKNPAMKRDLLSKIKAYKGMVEDKSSSGTGYQDGATKEYGGKTYKLDGDNWVEVP
jgi:hypothetical protein